MGSRILLNLKEIAQEEQQMGISTHELHTDMAFAPPELSQHADSGGVEDNERYRECGTDWLEMEEMGGTGAEAVP